MSFSTPSTSRNGSVSLMKTAKNDSTGLFNLLPPHQRTVFGKRVVAAATRKSTYSVNRERLGTRLLATGEDTEAADLQTNSESVNNLTDASQNTDEGFIKVLSLDELPKGERREVNAEGKSILVFWYRNELLACESRSPAEGVYSIGFRDARFTQDYGIVCPTTATVFSLKTGEILEWYPDNPVLRFLTPVSTCRPLELYPVKVEGNDILVSFRGGTLGGIESRYTGGGSETSIDSNNVFFMEPKVYIENQDEDIVTTGIKNKENINPVTVLVGTVAVAIISIAGTGLFIYLESVTGLIIFWSILFTIAAIYLSRYLNLGDNKQDN